MSEKQTWLLADRDAAAQQHPQMIGVEIGDADGGDQPFIGAAAPAPHGVEIGRMLVHPPMELQEIDALDVHAR